MLAEQGQLPTSQRIRAKLGMTVHPKTLDRLDELATRLGTNRGRLVDRMTEVLHSAYADGVVRCCHGAVCQINRKDLPGVM